MHPEPLVGWQRAGRVVRGGPQQHQEWPRQNWCQYCVEQSRAVSPGAAVAPQGRDVSGVSAALSPEDLVSAGSQQGKAVTWALMQCPNLWCTSHGWHQSRAATAAYTWVGGQLAELFLFSLSKQAWG